MSSTRIIFLRKKSAMAIDIRNAWRGAMYIWSDFAKRYWGMSSFPTFGDEDKRMQVWNTAGRKPGKVPLHEIIALQSTMDNVLLEPSRWKDFVAAIDQYGDEHPASSFKEQAESIRGVMSSRKGRSVVGIGFNQNTVCADTPWIVYDDNGEKSRPYCPETGGTHYWLMAEADELSGVATEVPA